LSIAYAKKQNNLRKQAEGMREGICRDELLRKANQMDVAIQVNNWLTRLTALV